MVACRFVPERGRVPQNLLLRTPRFSSAWLQPTRSLQDIPTGARISSNIVHDTLYVISVPEITAHKPLHQLSFASETAYKGLQYRPKYALILTIAALKTWSVIFGHPYICVGMLTELVQFACDSMLTVECLR